MNRRAPSPEEARLVGAAIVRGESLTDIVWMLIDRQIDDRVAVHFVKLAEERILALGRNARRITARRQTRVTAIQAPAAT